MGERNGTVMVSHERELSLVEGDEGGVILRERHRLGTGQWRVIAVASSKEAMMTSIKEDQDYLARLHGFIADMKIATP